MAFFDFVHEARIRVRYSETDAAGLAHHAAYVAWLELARVEWLRAIGHSYADFERAGYHLAVVELTIKYVRPARFDDPLVVRVGITRVRSREVTFVYEIVTDEPRPRQLGSAVTRHVWLKGGSIAKAPEALARTIEGPAPRSD